MKRLVWGLVGAAVLTGAAAADIINIGPGDSIQQAIDAASDGDEIIAAPGTYSEGPGAGITFSGKAITLRSSDGAGVTTIQLTNPNQLQFVGGETSTTVIQGFTVLGSIGVAVLCDESSPTILDCILSTGSIGVLCGANGSPTITNCTFTGLINASVLVTGTKASP